MSEEPRELRDDDGLAAGDAAWIRVPIGEGSGAYVTVPFVRTILVVARTVTTTVWLLEFLEDVVGDDPRVQVLFTVEDDEPSVYHEEARSLLSSVEARVLPWSQACATSFDLVISSTQNGSLERLHGPLFITPHGPGFGKPASIRPRGTLPVATGFDGVPFETTLVLSHPDHAKALGQLEPNVQFLVVGDPAYDRIRASRTRRELYRRAFGVSDYQRLIVVTSTWGPGAQLGTSFGLAQQLAAELPADEGAIAMIIHPNIWFGHSPWQVRTWLRSAREAGVVLVPPRGDEWRAAVVASDIVVMDHGSVGFYAAAIGVPVILASFADSLVRPDQPIAELGELAPRLDMDRRLVPQLWNVFDSHDPARYRETARRMFAEGDNAIETMRAAIYDQIGLAPAGPGALTSAVSVPRVARQVVTSHLVSGTVSVSDGQEQVHVVRRPAGVSQISLSTVSAEPPLALGLGGGGTSISSSTRPSAEQDCWRWPRSSSARRPPTNSWTRGHRKSLPRSQAAGSPRLWRGARALSPWSVAGRARGDSAA